MGSLRGLGFGLAALAVYGYQEPFDSFDFLILEPATLNVGMFVGLFVAFGLAIPTAYWLLDRNLPEPAGLGIRPGLVRCDMSDAVRTALMRCSTILRVLPVSPLTTTVT